MFTDGLTKECMTRDWQIGILVTYAPPARVNEPASTAAHRNLMFRMWEWDYIITHSCIPYLPS